MGGGEAGGGGGAAAVVVGNDDRDDVDADDAVKFGASSKTYVTCFRGPP